MNIRITDTLYEVFIGEKNNKKNIEQARDKIAPRDAVANTTYNEIQITKYNMYFCLNFEFVNNSIIEAIIP